ncbi:nicotianamine synthase family protein [Jiangella anatolica]|uniref:Nicotianamine synthase n=1 Tax=Jiangella anatolica TaxID=2670374 RepID=A0A2W2BRM4_9ACTN|nr:nicotianamine synthase family protein [Jiangella anatolica]PZF83074.1 nicotianamine synthase [Jiangella anatolica]
MNMSLTSSIFGQTDRTGRRRPTAEDITASVCELYRDLAARDDLRPGPEVDGLFDRLVRLVLTAPAETVPAVLNDVEIQHVAPRLRALCARGEGELEQAWANRIVAGRDPREELARFPYFGNYRQLSRMEIGILASALPRRVRSVAFVGSGPLPLSSLYLAGELDASVDNFDRDPVALHAGAAVCAALGYGELGFHEADVLTADLSGYDVVVLAALVGETPEAKVRILRRLAETMRPGAVLLARSARGLRTLLYPPIDRTALDGFEPLTEVHPVNDVINSAILARAEG